MILRRRKVREARPDPEILIEPVSVPAAEIAPVAMVPVEVTTVAPGTVTAYLKLAEAGFAPAVLAMTDTEITTRRYPTLMAWLEVNPRGHRRIMARRIYDLLGQVHAELGICHRDVHTGNIVLAPGDQPLLIGPKWVAPSVNRYCYDLWGPEYSKVPVPDLHVRQGHACEGGVWWGTGVRDRSLRSAFGILPDAVSYERTLIAQD